MSDVLDGFEPVKKNQQSRGTPTLSIYGNGNGYLNAAADEVVGKPEAVQIQVNPETTQIAFVPTTADNPDHYQVSRDGDAAGGDVHTKTALDRLGIEWDVEETQFVDLESEGDVLIADLSAHLSVDKSDVDEADRDASADDDGHGEDEGVGTTPDEAGTEVEADEESSVDDKRSRTQDTEDGIGSEADEIRQLLDAGDGWLQSSHLRARSRAPANRLYEVLNAMEDEGEVERVNDPEDGRRTIVKYPDVEVRQDSDDDSSDDTADDQADSTVAADSDDDVTVDEPDVSGIEEATEETIRDCASAVDSIQDLADLFEATEAQARGAAKAADVYNELEDPAPRPMGMPDARGESA